MPDPHPSSLVAGEIAATDLLMREHVVGFTADLAQFKAEFTRRLWIVGALVVAGNVIFIRLLT